jgi:hypothetical protein
MRFQSRGAATVVLLLALTVSTQVNCLLSCLSQGTSWQLKLTALPLQCRQIVQIDFKTAEPQILPLETIINPAQPPIPQHTLALLFFL